MKCSVTDVLARIPGPPNAVWPQGVRSAVGMEHGSMQLRLFHPAGLDRQQPHSRDEIYVVIEGQAEFVIEHHDRPAQRLPCQPHDVLLVPAHVPHRFEHATAQFMAWVVFYGPEGGETGQPLSHGAAQ